MTKSPGRKRLFSIKFLFFVILLGTSMPFVLAGWFDLWSSFLENGKPKIELVELPRGVGIIPANISFRASDDGAGLDGVVVRVRQRGKSIDILKESYRREKEANVQFSLNGRELGLSEGSVEVEIRAFDESFWSNSAVEQFTLKVDFSKPQLKVLSGQHNIRRGGSQLVLYEASDETLGFHGVKVASQTFLGFHARGLDPAFEDTNVHAAFFSVDLLDPEDVSPRIFAEDQVGNGNSISFYHKVLPSPVRPERRQLTESFLKGPLIQMYSASLPVLQQWAREMGQTVPQEIGHVSIDTALSIFKFLNQVLRRWSDLELERQLHEQRLEKIWDGPFLQTAGTVRSAFGRKLFYDYKGNTVDTALQQGYEFSGPRIVKAANRGIVLFVKDIGIYGKTLALDHGLGIYSLYSWLSDVEVSVGEEVAASQIIASVGGLRFSPTESLHVQIRINGRAVNPREWWDRSWYYAHVVQKIENVKREIGVGEINNSL